jgi:hypothetical protein
MTTLIGRLWILFCRDGDWHRGADQLAQSHKASEKYKFLLQCVASALVREHALEYKTLAFKMKECYPKGSTHFFKKLIFTTCWWLMPEILATQEASWFASSRGQQFLQTLSRKKIHKKKGLVEWLKM